MGRLAALDNGVFGSLSRRAEGSSTYDHAPEVLKVLALRKELEDLRRTGSKRALFESLGEELCRRYKTDSPERLCS